LAGCFALGNDGTTAARLRHDAALKTHHASAQGRDVGDRWGGRDKMRGSEPYVWQWSLATSIGKSATGRDAVRLLRRSSDAAARHFLRAKQSSYL
jgi:hypothetical protein